VKAASGAAPSFWQRRVRGPVVALFTQGITPDKVAATFAVGTTCSLFPFLGLTSLLNLAVGAWLRLNQPLLQTLNQLLGPLHLLMIAVYVRLGEWLWGVSGDPFSIAEMIRTFREATWSEFLQRFGWAGIHALTAWTVTTPLMIFVLYRLLRPAMRRLAEKGLRAAG
jgi:uncharacterized protein (DUF2062 family)